MNKWANWPIRNFSYSVGNGLREYADIEVFSYWIAFLWLIFAEKFWWDTQINFFLLWNYSMRYGYLITTNYRRKQSAIWLDLTGSTVHPVKTVCFIISVCECSSNDINNYRSNLLNVFSKVSLYGIIALLWSWWCVFPCLS